MNFEIYIVGSIGIVGSIRISWGCDGIYESYVIAPIVPHCSYSFHYSHNINYGPV